MRWPMFFKICRATEEEEEEEKFSVLIALRLG
jgi:hypothetical protein